MLDRLLKRVMGQKWEMCKVPVTSYHLLLVCDGEYNDVESTYKSLNYWIDLRSHYHGVVCNVKHLGPD